MLISSQGQNMYHKVKTFWYLYLCGDILPPQREKAERLFDFKWNVYT